MVNFDPQHDAIELDNFANARAALQSQSPITSGAHGNAVIELGHNDSTTLPGMTADRPQASLQTTVPLHAGRAVRLVSLKIG